MRVVGWVDGLMQERLKRLAFRGLSGGFPGAYRGLLASEVTTLL